MSKLTSGDFMSPETIRNFNAFFTKLSEQQEPIIHMEDFFGMGSSWFLYRHDDVSAILKDPRFFSDIRKRGPQKPPAEENETMSSLIEWVNNMPNMLTVDPPDHTRLRRLASKAFTPRMIVDLQPRIQQIVDELLDAVQEQGHMELVKDLALPLPITVISEMLGIPESDRGKFQELTQTIMNSSLDPTKTEVIKEALDQFIAYIKTLLIKKREQPSDDVISGLLRAYDDGDKLSENELLSTIWLLITAGHETTVNLITNGLLALLQHPEQLQLLQNNPSLIPSAVEELLRFSGPVLMISRFAGEDITLYGKEIRKGEMVVLSLAANMDPHTFSNPQSLDITREENEHLSFGKGIHMCLGAPLARLEAQIAFRTLLQRLPNLRLAIEPEQLVYNPTTMRSLASLPLNF